MTEPSAKYGDVMFNVGLTAPAPDPAVRDKARRVLAGLAARNGATAVELAQALDICGLMPEIGPQVAVAPTVVPTPRPDPDSPPTEQPAPQTGPAPTVWVLGGRGFAHWESDCPERKRRTVCGNSPLYPPYAHAVPADRVAEANRCTSHACAARWRNYLNGDGKRFKCPRCKTFHDGDPS